MNCGKCNFSEIVPGTGMQRCALTQEIRLPADECNCEDYRSVKYREIEVAANKELTLKNLEKLHNRLSTDAHRVDPQYIMSILTDTTKEASIKITEAIEYLEDFV